MTYLTLALALTVIVQSLAWPGLLLKQERRHARRIDTLLDRLAHAHGRTWTPPPAEEKPEEPIPEYDFGVERDPELLT